VASSQLSDLDTDLGESFYLGSAASEDQGIDDIVKAIGTAIKGHLDAGKGMARRDAHAYDNGCVRALFRVDAHLAPDLQHGVFIPGKEYRAWIRCSNGNSEPRPKWLPDARGFAIKLMGVPGDKLMDDEQNTQDFILITYPTFFVDDLARYKTTLEAFLRGTLWDQFVNTVRALKGREKIIALASNLRWITNPLFQQYFSMVPYRLGPATGRKIAVKYMAKPQLAERPSVFSRVATFLSHDFSPKKEMNNLLAGKEMWFDFYIQRFADKERTPIEDSKVLWKETVSPYEHVAKIVIPMQDLMSEAQARFCENLSFSPWHGLAEHKPLGLVNRVRRRAYIAISTLRHSLNKEPRTEPTGDEVFSERSRPLTVGTRAE